MNLSERYGIIKPLGDARIRKFNKVYLCQEKASGKLAILKSLAKKAENKHLQERLRSEKDFAFNFTGLPETLDFLETDSEILLVKSFQAGKPFAAFIKDVKSRKKQAVLLLFLQKMQPLLKKLQSENIMHLDLKPGNILIDGNSDDFSVSLIDFGMAAKFPVEEKRSTLFALGYSAPELVLNRLHLADHRTDLFSLGIVLWKAFTGKMPLLHPNPSITTNLQITHPLPADEAIPQEVLRILNKMSAKHAFGKSPNRYSNDELDSYLREGMNERYDSLEEVITDWEQLKERKRWFSKS